MARGGRRKGAGRPKGTGKFGEPTKAVRLPVSKIDSIMKFIERNADMYAIYPSGERVDPVSVEQCDLNAELVTHPSSTFNVRVSDDSMKGAGIVKGDLLVADRSQEPKNGDIVVALLNGKLLVRRLVIKPKLTVKDRKLELKSESSKFPTLKIVETDDIELWGVAKNVVHSL